MNERLFNTWYPVGRLRAEMDSLLNDAFSDDWAFGRVRGGMYPALNLWEDDEGLYGEAEVPGLDMGDIELFVVGNELTIKGERKGLEQEGATYHRRERGFGSFNRVVRLPVEIDPEKVEASLEAGVLTIKLAKAASARPRKIEVKALSKS